MATRTPRNAPYKGKRKVSSRKTISVSRSSFGVSGAGSNAALLKKYGSPEAINATARNVTPLTRTQSARSASIPRTALTEANTLNANSPTTSIEPRGNIILGSRFDFGQRRTPTTVGIKSLTQKKNVERRVQQEQKQGFLSKLSSFANEYADTRNTFDSRIFGGYLLGGPTPKLVRANRTLQQTTALRAANEASATERIEKAMIDAETERSLAEQSGIADLYGTSFLERLGIGRSAEEKRIQELLKGQSFNTTQALEAQRFADSFNAANAATGSADFVAAQLAQQQRKNTERNGISAYTTPLAIGGALLIGFLLLNN